jgi:hypothetical protein
MRLSSKSRPCWRAVAVLVIGLAAGCGGDRTHEVGGDDRIGPTPATPRGGESDAESPESARATATFLNDTVRGFGPGLGLVAVDAAQRTVAAGYDGGRIAVWTGADGRRPWELAARPDRSVDALVLSRDGALLGVIQSERADLVFELQVWRVADHRLVLRADAPDEYIRAVWFGPDGSTVMATYAKALEGSLGARLTLFGPDGRRRTTQPPTGDSLPVGSALSHFGYEAGTGRYLAVANSNAGGGGYLAWKPGEPARFVDVGCDTNGAFSADGKLFACAAGPERTITVFDVERSTERAHWAGQGGRFNLNAGACTFFASGRGLAVEQGAHDAQRLLHTTIRLYDVDSHRLLREHQLPPMPNAPDLAAQELGGDRLLLYKVNEGESGEVFYAFPPVRIR